MTYLLPSTNNTVAVLVAAANPATSSFTLNNIGAKEVDLVINVTAITSGSITFTITEIDPGNASTTVTGGTTVAGTAISTATQQVLTLPLTRTGAVKVSWTNATLVGATVYATLALKESVVAAGVTAAGAQGTVLIDASGNQSVVGSGTAGTPAGGVLSIQGVSGGTVLPVTGTVISNQGTAGTAAQGWFSKVTDGTNITAVKANNTAATASDPSFVVAMSPNSSLPAGSNGIGTIIISGSLTAVGTSPTVNPVIVGGFDSGGVARRMMTDTSGNQTAVGTTAVGSAVSGPPVLVGGKDSGGNAQYIALANDKSQITLLGTGQINVATALALTTGTNISTGLTNINAAGAGIYSGFGNKELNLIIDVTAAATPTLTFTIQEVDPQSTATTVGSAVTSVTINATGVYTIKLADTITGTVKVTYTLSAGTATASVTLTSKPTEDIIEQFAPVAEDNTNGVIAQAIKPLAVATYSPSFSSGAASLPGIIKGTPGNVFSITVTSFNATVRFIQLFNLTGGPAGTPFASFPVPAGTAVIPSVIKIGTETFTQSGINLSTGISLGISTTGTTYTAATAADHYWSVTYI